MNAFLQMPDLGGLQWITIIIAAFLVGFSKTGIGGMMMLAIPMLASSFGGKDSTGIMLPMLLTGDLFAVFYYRRGVEWKKVISPLPWALTGVLVGALAGNYISDRAFIILIGSIVLLCLIVLVYTERKGNGLKVPEGAWFYILVGILSGFTSMIGNAAGPIFSIYLLALGFKKNNYMGTGAWFFFIINSVKLPFQVFLWHNIGLSSLVIAVIMIPVVTIGAITGYYVLKKINEKYFRYIVIIMTAMAAFKLLI